MKKYDWDKLGILEYLDNDKDKENLSSHYDRLLEKLEKDDLGETHSESLNFVVFRRVFVTLKDKSKFDFDNVYEFSIDLTNKVRMEKWCSKLNLEPNFTIDWEMEYIADNTDEYCDKINNLKE